MTKTAGKDVIGVFTSQPNMFRDELVSIAYEAVTQPGHWQCFIEQLVRSFDSDCGDFVTESATKGTTEIFGSTGYDPYFRELYEQGIHENNIWANNLRDSGITGASHSDCGLISRGRLESSMFYNEWLKPQDLRHSVSAPVCKSSKQMTFFGVVRSKRRGPYNVDDTQLLTSIARHVKRAVDLSNTLEREQRRTDCALSALDHWNTPIILFGASGSVDYCNQAAERLLVRADGLRMGPGRKLSATFHSDSLALSAAIRRAAGYDAVTDVDPTSPLPIHRRSGRPLVVVVSPMRGKWSAGDQPLWRTAAIVLDPDQRVNDTYNVLTHLFELTPKESELALHVARGESIEQFADANGIRASTARWHLKNILAKTDTHRQTELARLLSNVLDVSGTCKD